MTLTCTLAENTPLHERFYAFEVGKHVERYGYDREKFLEDHIPTSAKLEDLNFKFYSHGTITGYQQLEDGIRRPILVMRFTPFDVMLDERKQD